MTKNPAMRIFSLLTMIAALFLFTRAFAADSTPDPAGDRMDALALQAKEPPLGQDDIDRYIALLPAVASLQEKPPEELDHEKIGALLNEHGVSPVRFSVLVPKISIATMEVMGIDLGERLAAIPEAVRPSPDEVALVEKNWDKIQEAYMALPGNTEAE